MPQTADQRRTLRIKAIHAAARALGLTDDERHDIQRAATGKASLTDMTYTQLGQVLDRLNQKKGGYAGRARSAPAAGLAPLRDKVDALLAELHRATGRVHTLKYADAICAKNGWASCVDFCDAQGLGNLVGALTRTLQYKQAR